MFTEAISYTQITLFSVACRHKITSVSSKYKCWWAHEMTDSPSVWHPHLQIAQVEIYMWWSAFSVSWGCGIRGFSMALFHSCKSRAGFWKSDLDFPHCHSFFSANVFLRNLGNKWNKVMKQKYGGFLFFFPKNEGNYGEWVLELCLPCEMCTHLRNAAVCSVLPFSQMLCITSPSTCSSSFFPQLLQPIHEF